MIELGEVFAQPKSVLGTKALAILHMAQFPIDSPNRMVAWERANHQFSAKSVDRKTHELGQRGYLTLSPSHTGRFDTALSTLTDKGRQALESHHMNAG